MTKLTQIKTLKVESQAKLHDGGIESVEQLLEVGASKAGRKMLATQCGLTEKEILGWVNRADLQRISGVGQEYADLLESAGVDSVLELAQRQPVNLHKRLTTLNLEHTLVRRLPTEAMVGSWITQAKLLGGKVIH